METFPNWSQWKESRDGREPFQEDHERNPDYSFDRWLKMAQGLGDDVDSMVGQAKEKDKELDAKKQKQPKEKDVPPGEEEDDDLKHKEQLWNKLRDIASKRTKGPEKEQGENEDSSKN